MLNGRTVLVTGAAGGIGSALVSGFLSNGANVVASDLDSDRLSQLEARHADANDRLMTGVCDVSDPEACARSVEAVVNRFGALDVLVNNAGLSMGIIRDDHMTNLVGIEEIDPAVWQQFVNVNFCGAWFLTKHAIGGMRERGWGRIINVTTSFFTMLRGGFHPYGPAKAGMEAMAAGHAKEFEGSGVTVNVVVPGGPTDTPMVPQSSGMDRASLIRPEAMFHPMQWLCSEEAATTTGKRFVATEWDTGVEPAVAAARNQSDIAWPDWTLRQVGPRNVGLMGVVLA